MKNILLFALPALLAIMITGIIATNTAYGQEGPCDAVEWWMNIHGLNVVKNPSGDILGEGTFRIQFHVITDNPGEDIVTGIGDAKFTIKGTGEREGQTIKLVSNNLEFTGNRITGIITISGTAMSQSGGVWNVNAIIENFSKSSTGKKGTADTFELILESPGEITITSDIIPTKLDFRNMSKEQLITPS